MKLMVFSDSNKLANIFTAIYETMNSYGGNVPGEEYVLAQVCNLDTRCLTVHKYEVASGERPSVKLTERIERPWPGATKAIRV